ncbi:MAG: thioredoxin family protein [Chloroflexi bacterium]|nr:thioredoxin family protein [Chloroflexota bacterium]
MQRFVAPTVAKHQEQLALVEKDIDREPALARKFRVSGTPTFVVLDAQGRELGRVPPDNNPARFEQRLLSAARLSSS